ncbi:MAG: hypothetical protein HOZ81_04755 [Streptomyces sp.]|nr:hypothetical protein [Streptomyces sp.]
MTTTPLSTVTVDDWDDAEAYLAEHAGSSAHALTALTALHDETLHHIVIAPETRTVLWAYDNTPADGEGWTIDHLTASDAAEWASDQIEMLQDRMDNPEWYAEGQGDVDTDQEALDEYTSILRLALPEEPGLASASIKTKRRAILRQDTLWQRTYANLVRDLVGNERGGKTRAARQLHVTDVQIGRIIREDDQRRAQLDAAIRAARAH